MGSNSFISHRMLVAALKGGETLTATSANGCAVAGEKNAAPGFARPSRTGPRAARAARQWLNFPFTRPWERAAA